MSSDIEILSAAFKNNKKKHYNNAVEINYRIPSGSLKLDLYTSGGLPCGVHRFVGPNQTGKTSQALAFMAQFLKARKNDGKALYFNAEGRLTKFFREKFPNIKWVYSPEEWEIGTCLVVESNIYEFICQVTDDLIKAESPNKYYIVVDSIDALSTENDMDKNYGQHGEVASGPRLAGVWMRRVQIPVNRLGHYLVLISQIRNNIKTSMYEASPKKQVEASGGNALLHAASYILDFQMRYGSDIVTKNGEGKPDPDKNPIVAEMAKVVIAKSGDDNNKYTISYPVKRGGGIWVEKEIFDILISYGLLKKKGSWLESEENAVKEFNLPEKIQGEANFIKYLEENAEITKSLYESLSKVIKAE